MNNKPYGALLLITAQISALLGLVTLYLFLFGVI
jgi:hypothetical protein